MVAAPSSSTTPDTDPDPNSDSVDPVMSADNPLLQFQASQKDQYDPDSQPLTNGFDTPFLRGLWNLAGNNTSKTMMMLDQYKTLQAKDPKAADEFATMCAGGALYEENGEIKQREPDDIAIAIQRRYWQKVRSGEAARETARADQLLRDRPAPPYHPDQLGPDTGDNPMTPPTLPPRTPTRSTVPPFMPEKDNRPPFMPDKNTAPPFMPDRS